MDVTGWRKLHNEELYNLYSLIRLIKTKEDVAGRICSMHEGGKM
jgi:hypothetical protein